MSNDLLNESARLREPGRAAEIKRWAREAFALPEDASVIVAELRCTEAGCPPLETVIALLPVASPTRQHRIHKPMAEVTEADVRGLATAWASAGDHSPRADSNAGGLLPRPPRDFGRACIGQGDNDLKHE